MNNQSPPVNLNSPIVERAAKRAGMPAPEFVEMCVLQMIRVMELNPGDFMVPGSTPSDRLETLRCAIEFYEGFKKLTPENRKHIQAQFPDFEFQNPEE